MNKLIYFPLFILIIVVLGFFVQCEAFDIFQMFEEAQFESSNNAQSNSQQKKPSDQLNASPQNIHGKKYFIFIICF